MLTSDDHDTIVGRNVGATCSLHTAERHRSKSVDNDFECFQLESNWQQAAASTDLIMAMRGLSS